MTARSIAVAVLVSAALTVAVPTVSADATVKPHRFTNCKALNMVFPHGVGLKGAHDRSTKPVTNFTRNNAWYLANKGLDRDKDRIACEKR